MGITGVLTNVATRLHTAEALRPVVAIQSEAEKDTKGWERLPLTAQRIILASSATTGTSIPNSPPPTIHRFLNVRTVTALQDDCFLTYAGGGYLFTHLLLPVPPPRSNPDHPRPRRADGTFTSPNPFIFRRIHKRPAAGNSNPIPPVHGTGSSINIRGWQATGPEVPRPPRKEKHCKNPMGKYIVPHERISIVNPNAGKQRKNSKKESP